MRHATQTSPRKQPKQRRSRETVDAILTATAQVLVEDGYDHASTNRIAARAGVSIGSLYQYFPNKEALISELCERHMAEMMVLVQNQIAETASLPLEAAVRSLIRALLVAHGVDLEVHRLMIEQVPRIAGLEPLRRYNELVIRVIRGYLEHRRDEIRPDDLDHAVFLLVHSFEAITHAAVIERPELLESEAFADEVSDLVLRYLVE